MNTYKYNSVRFNFSLMHYEKIRWAISFIFNLFRIFVRLFIDTDTHYTEPFLEFNRRQWGATSGRGITRTEGSLSIFVRISSLNLHVFIQKLTKLDLSSNQIGDNGAQHLAEALQEHQVPYPFFRISRLNFHIDTYHTGSWFESNWKRWSTTSS